MVTAHHNEIRDRVTCLVSKSFMPMHVHYNPPHLCRSRCAKAKGSAVQDHTLYIKKNPEATEQMGDLLTSGIMGPTVFSALIL